MKNEPYAHVITRVFRMLDLLNGRAYNVGELATRLGVNQRTVYRYIALVREVGIIIEPIRYSGRWTLGKQPDFIKKLLTHEHNNTGGNHTRSRPNPGSLQT